MTYQPRFFKSVHPMKINALVDALSRFEHLPGFSKNRNDAIFIEGSLRRVNPKLPADLEKSIFERLSIKGEIIGDDEPFPAFKKIIQKSESFLESAAVSTWIGFEESGSRQNIKYHDTVSIHLDGDLRRLAYTSSGTVFKNPEYRRVFMRRVVEQSGIPLQIIENDDYFELAPMGNEKLRLLNSEGLGRNPSSFSCQITGKEAEELVDIQEKFVKIFGSSKIFTKFWKISPTTGPSTKNGVTKRIYKEMCSEPKRWPAGIYEIDLACTLPDIGILDEMRSLCGPEDRIDATVGGFDIGSKASVAQHVITQKEGHWIWIEILGDINLINLEYYLEIGLELVEEGWAFWEAV